MAKVERVVLCTCEGTMKVDGATAAAALGGAEVVQADRLCTEELPKAEAALVAQGRTVIACGQMSSLFAEIAEEIGAEDRLLNVDIRDRAGWTDASQAHAKQAALLAAAVLPRPATPVRDVVSEGTCLILGASDKALAAAEALAGELAVTCLLSDAPDDLTPAADFDVALGKLRSATGALGGFSVTVDGYRAQRLGGRGAATYDAPIDGAKSTCDIILDLRGEGPLFPADHKREGYIRADPGDPIRVERAIAEVRDCQGVFEKPLYIRFDESLCAHSRASQPGCARCLAVCPTGAIVPAGDTVSINPDICAGCGACAAVCPSGAASYDAPPVGALFARLRTLASAYRQAGGTASRLLVHEATGAEMIRLSARFGRGMPPDLIPLEVANVESFGHAEILAALGVGFATVSILPGPRTDLAIPEREIRLAAAILGRHDALGLLDAAEPDALEEATRTDVVPSPLADPILPVGGRREVTRLAATALTDADAPIPLPDGASYGAVVIDTDACTLCLSCVSLCPVGALGDNPDAPEVQFQETACLQCGICASTCPEDAITLEPRLDLSKEAMTFRVLHAEEPFECISCGKPFGVRSTIERIVEKLEGKHWMYSGSDNTKLIQMCDDCRIQAQYHEENSPFRMGDRPRVRTTDDYLKDRKPN